MHISVLGAAHILLFLLLVFVSKHTTDHFSENSRLRGGGFSPTGLHFSIVAVKYLCIKYFIIHYLGSFFFIVGITS